MTKKQPPREGQPLRFDVDASRCHRDVCGWLSRLAAANACLRGALAHALGSRACSPFGVPPGCANLRSRRAHVSASESFIQGSRHLHLPVTKSEGRIAVSKPQRCFPKVRLPSEPYPSAGPHHHSPLAPADSASSLGRDSIRACGSDTVSRQYVAWGTATGEESVRVCAAPCTVAEHRPCNLSPATSSRRAPGSHARSLAQYGHPVASRRRCGCASPARKPRGTTDAAQAWASASTPEQARSCLRPAQERRRDLCAADMISSCPPNPRRVRISGPPNARQAAAHAARGLRSPGVQTCMNQRPRKTGYTPIYPSRRACTRTGGGSSMGSAAARAGGGRRGGARSMLRDLAATPARVRLES